MGSQRDVGVLRELERVLQQVPDGGEKQVPVDLQRKIWLDRGDGKPAAPRLSLERRGDFHGRDEVGKVDPPKSGAASGRQSHLAQGAIHEGAQSYQGAVQHGGSRPAQSYLAGFHGGHRERGGMDEITQVVREKTELFAQVVSVLALDHCIVLAGKFSDGIGDGIVQAAVESAKLVDLYRRAFLERQVRYRLAQI